MDPVLLAAILPPSTLSLIAIVGCLMLIEEEQASVVALSVGTSTTANILLALCCYLCIAPGRGNSRYAEYHPQPEKDVYSALRQFPTLFWRVTRHTTVEFDELLEELAPFISLPRNNYGLFTSAQNAQRRLRSTKLGVANRLLLILMWLTNYNTYPYLSFVFGIDSGVITQEVQHILPIIIVCLRDEIRWPDAVERSTLAYMLPGFHGVIGHVDGVVHRRQRPGHRQSAYYRGDKRCHFISTQMVVDHSGVIRHVHTNFPGHQQDQTNWLQCDLAQQPQKYFAPHQRLLADGIYHSPYLITPFTQQETEGNQGYRAWSRAQRHERQVIEWANGYLERFRALVIRCRHEIPVQGQMVMAGALLANRQLKKNPYRVY